MQFHSSSAKHKLSIVVLLLALFAIPFAMQWHSVTAFDSKALMAGGAVIGRDAFNDQEAKTPSTNHVSQLAGSVGNNFVGALAQ